MCLSWAASSIGYLRAPLHWPERIFVTIAAFLLVVALPWTDEVGFALCAAFAAWHLFRTRGIRQKA